MGLNAEWENVDIHFCFTLVLLKKAGNIVLSKSTFARSVRSCGPARHI
jgi:hypothetical protein